MYQQDINVDHVMKEYGISATAARALFHINRYIFAADGQRDSNGVPYCDVGFNTLAEATGKSRRTTDRAIAELKAAGLIRVERTRDNARIYLKGARG